MGTLSRRWGGYFHDSHLQNPNQYDTERRDRQRPIDWPGMELGLQLLMSDGAARLIFHPHLTAEQYAELSRIVDRATTRAGLKSSTEAAANRWSVELDFEEVGV